MVVDCLARSPAGRIAAAGSNLSGARWSGCVCVYNDSAQCALEELHASVETRAGNASLVWLNDAAIVGASDNGDINVWAVAPNAGQIKALHSVPAHDHVVTGVVDLRSEASEASSHVVSASHDMLLKLWDVGEADVRLVATYTGHHIGVNEVVAMDTSSTSHAFASLDMRGNVYLWDKATYTHCATLAPESRALSVEAVDNNIICGSLDGTVTVYDVRNLDTHTHYINTVSHRHSLQGVNAREAHPQSISSSGISSLAAGSEEGGLRIVAGTEDGHLLYLASKPATVDELGVTLLEQRHNSLVSSILWEGAAQAVSASWDGKVLVHSLV